MTARQLPPGRHGLDPEFVRNDQRDRILSATAEVASEIGFADMNVESIIAVARVSRRSFYEIFTDKQDAFATAIIAGYVKDPSPSVLVGPSLGEVIAEAVAPR